MKPSEAEAHEAADRIAARYADEDTARLAAFIAEWNECDRKMIEELGEIL